MAKKEITDNILKELLKASGNEFASIMDDDALSNTTEWISTGSRALDGLLGADIFRGIPNNKIVAFAGKESVGKTYLLLAIAKEAIKKGYKIIYFDSENSTEKEMVVKRNIDPKMIGYIPVDTAENFKFQANAIVNKYLESGSKSKVMMMLDSLGNLGSDKENRDADDMKNKVDMTSAKVVKSIFRVLSLKLAKAKIPFLLTNHVYVDSNSFIPQNIMSKGSGLKYASSQTIFLTKKKAKDKDGNIIGSYLTATNMKNRYAREGSKVTIYLDYIRGMHLNHGLQDFGGDYLKKESKGMWNLNGKEITEKELWSMKWDDELLNKINEEIKKQFALGTVSESDDIEMDEISESEEE